MAREGSVAPKERVNITYKSAASGNKEVELPLKILMLGDYTGREDDRLIEERKPINVNADNFNDVMEQHKLAVDVRVEDRLSQAPEGSDEPRAELDLHLEFKSMKDFGPEGIVAQVPELQRLMELRKALNALKGPLGNIPGFRKKLQRLLKDDTARARLESELSLGSGNDEE